MAQHNAKLSMRNYARSLRVPQALGLDAEQAKSLTQMTATIPIPMPKALLASMLALGRRPLRSLEKAGQPYGAACLTKARNVLRDGAGLPLLFPQDDLGFRYSPRGMAGEDKDESLALIRVGGRLPHIWLQYVHPETGVHLGKVSTTDLADQLHVALTNLDLPTLSFPAPFAIHLTSSVSDAHLGRASRLRCRGGEMPLLHVRIVSTSPNSELPSCATKTTLAELPRNSMEELCRHMFESGGLLQLEDQDGEWERRMQGLGTGVLLRPDGHVWAIAKSTGGLDQGEEGFRIV